MEVHAGNADHSACQLFRHQVRSWFVHRIKRFVCPKVEQPHRCASQRGYEPAPFFEIGKKVFAQADQELVVVRPQMKSRSRSLVVFDLGGQIGGNVVLGQVAKIISACPDEIRNPLAERKELFELVEDDHRCKWIILRTP